MAAQLYRNACHRDQVSEVSEVVTALQSGTIKELTLSHRKQPLNDLDCCCIAEALTLHHSIRVLDLEENKVGAQGVQALLDAFNVNPGFVRELRLGKNALRDPPVVALGNALSVEGAGLKVVDLSQNSISKLGAQAMSQALASRGCDLVELSFHCNDLDADAGLYLAQGVRASSRLKHLHLGYNSLRCGGTTHLARCLPIARSLLTLDLTANRIGTQGGADLVKALLSDSCNLQRLNLRHNNLDDDTISLFAQVLEKSSSSLQQLFLGYMNPSFETAELLLSTLAIRNTTLVCFDCYGWKLQHQAGPVASVDDIMRHNTVLRALVTDHDFGPMVDSGNQYRVSSGLHELYVGGDDRLAAQASLRHTQPPHHGKSQSRSMQQQQSASSVEHHQHVDPHTRTSSASPSRRNGAPATNSSRQGSRLSNVGDEDLDQLVSELDTVPCDPDLRNHLALIVAQLQLKMEVQRSHHQQQITLLEERIRLLERNRDDDKEDCSRRCANLVSQQLRKEKDAAHREQLKNYNQNPNSNTNSPHRNHQQHYAADSSSNSTSYHHNASSASVGSNNNGKQPPFKPASLYPNELSNRETPVKSVSPQRRSGAEPMTSRTAAAASSSSSYSNSQSQSQNGQSQPAQRPTSPTRKSAASQPRTMTSPSPHPRTIPPQATSPAAAGVNNSSSKNQNYNQNHGHQNQSTTHQSYIQNQSSAGHGQQTHSQSSYNQQQSQSTTTSVRRNQDQSQLFNVDRSDSPDPMTVNKPGAMKERNDSRITKERNDSRFIQQQSSATTLTSPNPRAVSPPARGPTAATAGGAITSTAVSREGSHGPGEGAVLSVPRHPANEAKIEHSPAPIYEDRSSTPDLQTSHHGQGQAPLAPQPQRSSAPSRPRGTKTSEVVAVVSPSAFSNGRK